MIKSSNEILNLQNWIQIEDLNCLAYETSWGLFCLFKTNDLYDCILIPKRGITIDIILNSDLESCLQASKKRLEYLETDRYRTNKVFITNEDVKNKRNSEIKRYLKFNKKASMDKVACAPELNAIEAIVSGTDEFIMTYSGGEYLIQYGKKDYRVYYLRLKFLGGIKNSNIRTGVYVGSPSFIVSAIKTFPKIIEMINYLNNRSFSKRNKYRD